MDDEIKPQYIQFTNDANDNVTKGALYLPHPRHRHPVALLVMHRTSNYLPHPACIELSKRGFVMLGMNPRFDNNETIVHFEEVALDVKAGVEFLRGLHGIKHVLLLGHSGGGPTMTFYQATAECGLSYSQNPRRLHKSGDELAKLPPADGVVLMDADPGHNIYRLRNMMPMPPGCQDPHVVDPALDPFNPKNGFNPTGASTYSHAFRERYFAAQSERMNGLIAEAQAMLEKIEAGKGKYPDDDLFVIVRATGASLWELDPSVAHHTAKPRQLLKNDGTISTQIVENVRVATTGLDKTNASFTDGTEILTVRSFLSTQAIRSTNALDGIEWCSSNNSTTCALQHITVPLMIATMGAWIYMRDNEVHFEHAKSSDKDFVVIEGALHDFQPCTACETRPGEYSNTVRNLFDYTAAWLEKRYH